MTDRARLWARRALYPAVAAGLTLAGLLPIGHPAPGALPPPDALLLVTLAWVARRPAEAPTPVLAAVLLAADLVLQRPPGLHAALALAAAEWLRGSASRAGGGGFWGEWARAAALVLLIVAGERLVLALALVPQAPPGPALVQALVTAAAYPLAALALRAVGVRRPRPGAPGQERPA